MSQTVSHISNQIKRITLRITQQSIYSLYQHLYDVDVLPFVETAYVISIRNLSVMENHAFRYGKSRLSHAQIHHIQPVAHVLTFAIHRQRLAVTNIVDEQRNQLLRELIRPIVVRTVSHYSRHPVSIMISDPSLLSKPSTGCADYI